MGVAFLSAWVGWSTWNGRGHFQWLGSVLECQSVL